MNIFTVNGYLDAKTMMASDYPFIICVGARGVGKTFSFLDEVVNEDKKFIYMRRTKNETDLLSDPRYDVFKKINEVTGKHVAINHGSYYKEELNDNNEYVSTGVPIGHLQALSTFAGLRGFDASDIEVLIYDEFIPEKHIRTIKNEASAFLNAYESINRNRELDGGKPLQAILLANSNDLACPLFIELGLVTTLEKMKRKGQWQYLNKDRGIAIFLIDKSPISEKKKDTALYRLTGDSDFSKMALENEFSSNEFGMIKSRNLTQYNPVVKVGELTIYSHKSKQIYYVTTHHSGSCPVFTSGSVDIERFVRSFSWLRESYMMNHIEFEEYICQVLFEKYFGMS